MSFVGSAARAWKRTKSGPEYDPAGSFGNKVAVVVIRVAMNLLALSVIALWWAAIVIWYLLFGILVIPWRLLRRGSRKRKREALRHQEILDAAKRK